MSGVSGIERLRTAAVRRDADGGVNWVVPLFFVYLWFLVATPFSRFPVLTDIRFERILVAAVILVALVGGRFALRLPGATPRVLALYGWMLLAWLFSPHGDFELTQRWIGEYWKVIVFHLLFVWCLTRVRDVSHVLIAFAAASLLYQAHSWFDFVRGGSYVYQQGIKRIVGVWTEGGRGAGNTFGFLAVISLPFVEYALRASRPALVRLAWLGGVALCLGSVVFSGTRAALVTAVLFGLLHFRSRRSIWIGAIALVVLLLAFNSLPADLQARYSTILGSSDESYAASGAGDTAIRSGRTRIEGLLDGLELAAQRPLLGHGPGASMIARYAINPTPFREDREQLLQLHNLYGQVAAELGFVGLALFGWVVFGYFRIDREIGRLAHPDAESLARIRLAMQQAMILMLAYGMFSHNLYRHHWLFLIGMQAALLAIVRRQVAESGR